MIEMHPLCRMIDESDALLGTGLCPEVLPLLGELPFAIVWLEFLSEVKSVLLDSDFTSVD